MVDLQHMAVVDEAPVTREGAGGEDTVGTVGEDPVEGALMEIAVAGVVSGSLERSLVWRLTYNLGSAHRGRGGGDFRGRGEGKGNLRVLFLILTNYLYLSGYRGRGDGEWRGRGDGERRGRGDGEWRGRSDGEGRGRNDGEGRSRGDGEWRGRSDGEWRGRSDGKGITILRSR